MTDSPQPYLLRAIYDWIVDNDHTPLMLVDASADSVLVPAEYVERDRIVLNVSPGATEALSLGNEEIAFSARFGAQSMNVSFPVSAVLGVYARETGRGIAFAGDEGAAPAPDDGPGNDDEPPKRPVLTVVK